MSDVEICLDAGSTHMGKRAYAKELVSVARDAGADVVKFQLFPNLPEYTATGNVHLTHDLFSELYQYGKDRLPVTASVFDYDHLEFLSRFQVPFIKFGYSKRKEDTWIKGCLVSGKRVVVSSDSMHDHRLPSHPSLTRLYCISEYPVKYEVAFDGIFPRFDGFSDHTLGWSQTLRAVEMGANFIEKHIKLEYSDVTCPDSYFALSPKEAAKMVREIRAVR